MNVYYIGIGIGSFILCGYLVYAALSRHGFSLFQDFQSAWLLMNTIEYSLNIISQCVLNDPDKSTINNIEHHVRIISRRITSATFQTKSGEHLQDALRMVNVMLMTGMFLLEMKQWVAAKEQIHQANLLFHQIKQLVADRIKDNI